MEGQEDLDRVLAFINLGFSGVTGLNLENDVLAWMDGNFALFLRILAAPRLVPDFGFLVETTDLEAARRVFTSLNDALDQYGVEYREEEINGVSVTVLPDIAPEIDIVFGVSETAFVVGTREGVTDSLGAAGGGLAADPTFIAAQAYFVENPTILLYLNPAGLSLVVSNLAEFGSEQDRRDAQDLRVLLALLESASISSAVGDGFTVMRVVLTLAE
jgi:hypothetical protein